MPFIDYWTDFLLKVFKFPVTIELKWCWFDFVTNIWLIAGSRGSWQSGRCWKSSRSW